MRKRKRKIASKKWGFIKGSGSLFTILIIGIIIVGANIMSGQIPWPKDNPDLGSDDNYFFKQTYVYPTVDPKDKSNERLQLKTFQIKTCAPKVVIDFLIDVSGSMLEHGKINAAQSALSDFTQKLSGDSVIGIQTFSETSANVLIPMNYYKNVKDQVRSQLYSLVPYGSTPTRDGFNLAKQELSSVIKTKVFSDYKYYLVFMSDGIPEDYNNDCEFSWINANNNQPRCFARMQDPRIPTNVPQDIKTLGVETFSIAITDDADRVAINYLESLMKDAASSPSATHYFASADGSNVNTILNNIFKDICQ